MNPDDRLWQLEREVVRCERLLNEAWGACGRGEVDRDVCFRAERAAYRAHLVLDVYRDRLVEYPAAIDEIRALRRREQQEAQTHLYQCVRRVRGDLGLPSRLSESLSELNQNFARVRRCFGSLADSARRTAEVIGRGVVFYETKRDVR